MHGHLARVSVLSSVPRNGAYLLPAAQTLSKQTIWQKQGHRSRRDLSSRGETVQTSMGIIQKIERRDDH